MSEAAPVLVVTNHVPPERAGAFAALHARRPLELALFGGRSHHATEGVDDPEVPHRHIAQRDVRALVASGDWSAVVCGTAGRVALPAAWTGARRARRPFVLWSALWAPLRTPAHLAATPLLRAIHATAGAVAAYGPHVAAHARSLGARQVHLAPQAVDQAFWTAPAGAPAARPAAYVVAFVGRADEAKGLGVLLEAWRSASDGAAPEARALRLVGVTEDEVHEAAGGAGLSAGVHVHGPSSAEEVRNFLAGSDVLCIPSLATAGFREPWALVANEAMHQGLPVITTTMVGAAAGGLVRDGRNGRVVPAGDSIALARAIGDLADPETRRALGGRAHRDVRPYTFEAWAAGMDAAIETASRVSAA